MRFKLLVWSYSLTLLTLTLTVIIITELSDYKYTARNHAFGWWYLQIMYKLSKIISKVFLLWGWLVPFPDLFCLCNWLLRYWAADSCLFQSLPFHCPSAVSKISGPGPAHKSFGSSCSAFVCSNMCVAVTAQWYKRLWAPPQGSCIAQIQGESSLWRKGEKQLCMSLVQTRLKKSQIIPCSLVRSHPARLYF